MAECRSILAVSLDYLTDIIILLTAAVIVVPLSRLARLGTVPGFLIAGVAVGPSVLGLIDNQVEIGHLAELGVVLLLFVLAVAGTKWRICSNTLRGSIRYRFT